MTRTYASFGLDRGFTLVELLVALTIMAMVAGLLMNSMSFSVNMAETVESGLYDVESLHQAQRAFRRQVQLARPLLRPDGPESQVLEFGATSSQLDFVAPLPGLSMGDLMYRISLQIVEPPGLPQGAGSLVMRYRPYLDGFGPDSDDDVREAVLFEGFSSASFSYLDTLAVGAGSWSQEWRHTARLPDLVRLSIDFDGAKTDDPTEFIVAIKAPLPVHQGAL